MRCILITFFLLLNFAGASPTVDEKEFGKALGGWDDNGKYADFKRSGSKYRTWKPEVTPRVNGGVFVSLRIDHLRGAFASDDHASLEVTFAADGTVESARSSLALQGKRVTSDLIAGTGKLGANVVGLDRAAKVGADLIADLSAKILRENIREPGRVTFPAVINHNYNLLCFAVKSPPRAEMVPDGKSADKESKPEVIERPIFPKRIPLEIEKPAGKR